MKQPNYQPRQDALNVLPGDMKLAAQLLDCCDYATFRARTAMYANDLAEAERWCKELLRCKRDLDKLVERKKEHDKLVQIVEEMQRNGIDVSIVARGIK
ncbi:hypothetical protein [Geobacillus stearothermophilus]|uniref:Uncharacterized protein n=1 Tax=Geobacillus stearothermophilus TaxID=1422 RepID=A0A150MUM1_GEOSE|nr:hypothetical protein [Geobacillus stearothermophilus]KYD28079.1 hypothetical protein B4109_1211 [Geobacillus stearothermophilus]